MKALEPSITEQLKKVYGIVSVVQNDTNFVKDDGKRFLFVGGGCGFAWYEYDKRNKKTSELIKEVNDAIHDWRSKFAENFQKQYKDKVSERVFKHCPAQAVMLQDMSFNSWLLSEMSKWIEMNGGKIKYVNSRLD